jgi:hypothetical protein
LRAFRSITGVLRIFFADIFKGVFTKNLKAIFGGIWEAFGQAFVQAFVQAF